eukprot:m.316050 g.316050  ORF g.316050 m.316050 type:complete len:56 (+) comp55458_c2_seq9:46-213(+)
MRPLNPSTKPQSLSPRKSEALVHFHRVFSNRMNDSNGRPGPLLTYQDLVAVICWR